MTSENDNFFSLFFLFSGIFRISAVKNLIDQTKKEVFLLFSSFFFFFLLFSSFFFSSLLFSLSFLLVIF